MLTCPVPVSSQILHGAVEFRGTDAVLGQLADFAEEITVVCDSGFTLNGIANPVCNMDRKISQLPTCEGKNH